MTFVMPPPPEYPVPMLRIDTARAFKPLLHPSRYKGVFGGRGSGKSHFFGDRLVEKCMLEPGTNAVCIREVQKTLAGSSKRIVERKIAKLGLGQYFNVLHDRIITPGNGVITFQGMTSHTAESIKSLEGINIAWIDEAQSLSARSLSLLLPTIRAKDSEIWASWNPTRKNDAIDDFFRGNDDHSERESPWAPPPNSICVEANWRDNPWWHEGTLEAERLLELERFPDRYQHTYEGGYARAFEGAYFGALLARAKLDRRIGIVTADPLLPVRAFHDIGGPSANADAYTIWIVQWVDQHIRVLNYYESVGQSVEYHAKWMRKNGYEDAINYLPHDGARVDGSGNRYEDHWRRAGFKVEPSIKNKGEGAAKLRIEAVRRIGTMLWFNEKTTEAGRDALGFYHEKKDNDRGIGLGPSHDWASHGCFHGETELVTRYGMCRIMNLPENGEVLTPCGWKQYILPRITMRNAPLVEVAFTDGYSVKCTPDHLFLTESGWKSAESLIQNTAIRSTLTNSRNIVRIDCVKRLSETADVWDITVPDGRWFSLANGAVVHNSDAFGLMAICYEDPARSAGFSRKLIYPGQGYA